MHIARLRGIGVNEEGLRAGQSSGYIQGGRERAEGCRPGENEPISPSGQ